MVFAFLVNILPASMRPITSAQSIDEFKMQFQLWLGQTHFGVIRYSFVIRPKDEKNSWSILAIAMLARP
jgi:hypothetical protein